MECRICHKENPEGAKFCMHCGNKIVYTKTCKNCSASDLPFEAQYCFHCGCDLKEVSKPSNNSVESDKSSAQR